MTCTPQQIAILADGLIKIGAMIAVLFVVNGKIPVTHDRYRDYFARNRKWLNVLFVVGLVFSVLWLGFGLLTRW